MITTVFFSQISLAAEPYKGAPTGTIKLPDNYQPAQNRNCDSDTTFCNAVNAVSGVINPLLQRDPFGTKTDKRQGATYGVRSDGADFRKVDVPGQDTDELDEIDPGVTHKAEAPTSPAVDYDDAPPST